jgi:uncharacterized RDD family membrane protein YckC
MSFEDQLHIATPEGVDVELTLAGLGSRAGGVFLDMLIKWATEFALLMLFAALLGLTSGVASAITVGVMILVLFAVEFGYDVLFEVLGSGKTIGKRATGTRVLLMSGAPVDFRSSAIRNLLRLVDGPLTAYIVGIVMILATSRHQRLGDLAAGTVVVVDRIQSQPTAQVNYIFASGAPRPWDVGRVDRDVTAALRSFLARRDSFAPVVRARIARELFERVRPMVGGVA